MCQDTTSKERETDGRQFLLKEKGYIYTEQHEGWYSVTDEAFYPDSAVQRYLDPPTGRKLMVSCSLQSWLNRADYEDFHRNWQ